MEEEAKLGRPTKHSKSIDTQVYKLSLAGFSNEKIIDILGISNDTFYNWKNNIKTFSESLAKGREPATAKVAASLFKKATGYKHKTVELKVVSQGNGLGSTVEHVEVTKHVQPDVSAAIFWLKNRAPDTWKDKHEVESNVNVTGYAIGFDKPEATDENSKENG